MKNAKIEALNYLNQIKAQNTTETGWNSEIKRVDDWIAEELHNLWETATPEQKAILLALTDYIDHACQIYGNVEHEKSSLTAFETGYLAGLKAGGK